MQLGFLAHGMAGAPLIDFEILGKFGNGGSNSFNSIKGSNRFFLKSPGGTMTLNESGSIPISAFLPSVIGSPSMCPINLLSLSTTMLFAFVIIIIVPLIDTSVENVD